MWTEGLRISFTKQIRVWSNLSLICVTKILCDMFIFEKLLQHFEGGDEFFSLRRKSYCLKLPKKHKSYTNKNIFKSKRWANISKNDHFLSYFCRNSDGIELMHLDDQTEKGILINGYIWKRKKYQFFLYLTIYQHEGYTLKDNKKNISGIVEHGAIWIMTNKNG